MNTSLPRLFLFCAILAMFATIPVANLHAQVLNVPSLRSSTPNDIERDDPRVGQLIEKAESHFQLGEQNLKNRNPDAARAEFDKAVDVLLESGMNVRAYPRLQVYYLQLVERVYRMEAPSQSTPSQLALATPPQQGIGKTQPATTDTAVKPQIPIIPQTGFLREQKFEPSPLDELSRLELTDDEKQVSSEDVAKLEEAKNAVDFKFSSNTLIQQFINYYQGRGHETMEAGLRRSGRFMKMARQIFRQEGVPEDLVLLGQVESAWRPTAYSSAAASGLWQFVPSTGSRYGLRQTAWIDERNSFEKATRASAKYLKWLSQRYGGNWELAMAGYNTGEGNVDRAIARAGVANFWEIYPYIAQQTRNYVPNILATILIAKNPEKYGFHGVRPESPLAYDVVSMPSATSLQLIANVTDTNIDYLRGLNPELRRDITPRGESYNVRVPAGRGRSCIALLKRVPADRREEVAHVISVAPGEDLQAVAARTGTTVAQIQLWNGNIDLKNGGKLIVPASALRNVAMVRARPNLNATGSSLIPVHARAGETIAQIAARYHVAADEVARLNGVAPDAALSANQLINVPAQAPAHNGGTPRRVRRRR